MCLSNITGPIVEIHCSAAKAPSNEFGEGGGGWLVRMGVKITVTGTFWQIIMPLTINYKIKHTHTYLDTDVDISNLLPCHKVQCLIVSCCACTKWEMRFPLASMQVWDGTLSCIYFALRWRSELWMSYVHSSHYFRHNNVLHFDFLGSNPHCTSQPVCECSSRKPGPGAMDLCPQTFILMIM